MASIGGFKKCNHHDYIMSCYARLGGGTSFLNLMLRFLSMLVVDFRALAAPVGYVCFCADAALSTLLINSITVRHLRAGSAWLPGVAIPHLPTF